MKNNEPEWVKSLREFDYDFRDIPEEDFISGRGPMNEAIKRAISIALTKYSPEERKERRVSAAAEYYQRNRERILLERKIDPKDYKVRTYGPVPNRRKTYCLTYSDGRTIMVKGLNEWCAKNNYSRGNLNQVFHGKRKSHKGIVDINIIYEE